MHALGKDLAVFHVRVAFLEIHMPLADRLDLSAVQGKTALVSLLHEIIVTRATVRGNGFDSFLLGHAHISFHFAVEKYYSIFPIQLQIFPARMIVKGKSAHTTREVKNMLTIFLRAVLLYGLSIFAIRMMGKRQIGQLQPYELVAALLVADLAAGPIAGSETPLL